MAAADVGEFPLSSSRVPDAETQAKAFLTKRPEADGRGVVIAVMDTGCDPGAPGLQVTSQGHPKIIDCVDCTGSGDVDTSTVLTASDNQTLKSPHTERCLKLGSGDAWANPTGKWHVGMKKAYELFDSDLVKRVKKERLAAWTEQHRGYVAEARRKLAAFDVENPKPEGQAVRTRLDLEERISQLEALQKDFEDQGEILDVVSWHDGKLWRACVGGKPDGDLSAAPALASFAAERQWACLGDVEQLNYCLNVYDEGSVVSICCDISGHGTHVAGICAACHPEEPQRNGVAPGAQIVALKIGDTRMDGMETGTGLARAFAHCVKSKVDLINLSFGESSSPATVGRVIEVARRTVEQHGITFVTSAGNSGPGLSTIGCPGNGSDTFITVGAYVSSVTMEAQYSMLEKLPSTPYTWSSRGPTQDGSIGVTLCAPGSAITSVPNWTLSGAQLMNGTSMASPNACGCLALVVSGLKAASIAHSPASLLRAARASALELPGADPFAVGAGMIQVESCYEYMVANQSYTYQDVTFAVKVLGGRGVYLREPCDSKAPRTLAVKVDPQFKELDPSLNRQKIDMELNVALVSSVSWVKTPPYVVIPSAGRAFNISVDSTGLQRGDIHLGFVSGFDTARPNLGALFRVPISVACPISPTLCPILQEPPKMQQLAVQLKPGTLHRTFVAVPNDCTWADITLTTKSFDGGSRVLIVHVMQDLPHVSTDKCSEEFVFQFTAAGTQNRTLRVEGSGTLEVTLAQNWSSLGATVADLAVNFHGIRPDVTKVSLSIDNPTTCVHVLSGPGAVTIKPSASLTTHRTSCRPKSSVICPGGERDIYPEGKQVYELVLEYAFKVEENTDVTPQALLLNDRLYESAFESQLLLVYDSNKRFLGCTDAWPTPLKLKKGDYVVRLQVRHEDLALLQRMKSMPLAVDRKLEKPVSLKAYSSFNAALTAQGEHDPSRVKGMTRAAVFFASPVDEKLPDFVKPGDLLLGAVTYGEPSVQAAGKHTRGGFTVQYAVTTGPPAAATKEEEAEEDLRTPAEKLQESLRDAQIKHLETLRNWKNAQDHKVLLAELLTKDPKHLPLHLETLAALESIKDPQENEEQEKLRLQEIVTAADKLLESVDLDELARQLGRRVDKDDKQAVRASKEWSKTRDAVVEASSKKITALAKLDEKSACAEQVAAAYKALGTWVDVTEAKYARLTSLAERAAKNFGLALAALNKHIGEEKGPARKELLEERAELLQALGWSAWADHERLSFVVKFPKAYSRL